MKQDIGGFTYFDFVAHIVPGVLLLGAAVVLTGSTGLLQLSGNAAIDVLIFAVASFAAGAFVHQLSRHLIEPFLKTVFWRGRFYSEIYLVQHYALCRDPLRAQILDVAESFFHFERGTLAALDSDPESKGSCDPHVISHQIYRCFDYYTVDKSLAKKGHIANTMYSLYRTLTLGALILTVLFAVGSQWNDSLISNDAKVTLSIISFTASVVLLLRMKGEGERYVQGVLAAVPKSTDLSAFQA